MTMLSAGAGPASDPVATPGARASTFPRPVCPRRYGLGVAVALTAIGAFFAIMAAQLDLGTFDLPGPGFIPLILGVALVCLGAAILRSEWRTAPAEEPVDLGHAPVAITCLLLLAACATFEPLGAYLSLGLFAAAFLTLIAKLHPLKAALGAALGMAAVWLFFHKALGVQLPTFGL